MEKIRTVSERELEVWVKESAEKGKANRAVLKLLSARFGGKAILISGHASRRKLIEIEQ